MAGAACMAEGDADAAVVAGVVLERDDIIIEPRLAADRDGPSKAATAADLSTELEELKTEI